MVNIKTLQTLTAIIEAGAGLALLVVPSATASLLFGAPLERYGAESLARVGGASIMAPSIACWLARHDTRSPVSRGLIAAMLFYNIAVAGILAFAGFGLKLDGLLLWPAAAFHVMMSVWCISCLASDSAGHD